MKRILTLVFLAVSLAGISLALLMEANLQVKSEALRNLATEELLLARQAARGIQDFFESRKRTLQLFVQNPHLIRMDEEGKQLLAKLLATYPETLRAASRVAPDGRILYSLPSHRVTGQNIAFCWGRIMTRLPAPSGPMTTPARLPCSWK